MARKLSSVTVLGHRMRVRRKDRLFDSDGVELCGYCDFDKREIWLSEAPSVDQDGTLLHEILHAILHYSGQGAVMGIKEEEVLVTALEHCLKPLLKLLTRQ